MKKKLVAILACRNNSSRLYAKPLQFLDIDKKVTVIAITIPRIPKKLPCLDVSGEDNPLKARINNTPETK